MYDGCVYLSGYVVEFALKARICKILDLEEYPDKGDSGKIFKTHDFEILLLLAGLQKEVSLTKNKALFDNWSTATKWKPEQRYSPAGTHSEIEARDRLSSIKNRPNGVLAWLIKRW
jgi:hypothetical protein